MLMMEITSNQNDPLTKYSCQTKLYKSDGKQDTGFEQKM